MLGVMLTWSGFQFARSSVNFDSWRSKTHADFKNITKYPCMPSAHAGARSLAQARRNAALLIPPVVAQFFPQTPPPCSRHLLLLHATIYFPFISSHRVVFLEGQLARSAVLRSAPNPPLAPAYKSVSSTPHIWFYKTGRLMHPPILFLHVLKMLPAEPGVFLGAGSDSNFIAKRAMTHSQDIRLDSGRRSLMARQRPTDHPSGPHWGAGCTTCSVLQCFPCVSRATCSVLCVWVPPPPHPTADTFGAFN